MKISDSHISVVVQGPIFHKDGLTANCLKSIRKQLPSAEIILSTWRNSDLSGLDFDIAIESPDPGQISDSPYQNTNRLIVSSKNGLEKATREYAIKLRTDNVLTHCRFMDYFNKFDKYDSRYKIFTDRVVALSTFAKNPSKWPGLFHISDLFYFGYTEDIKKIFDIRLIDIESYRNGKIPILAPEQYIWLSCLNNAGYQYELAHFAELSITKLAHSERSMINNFVFIEPEMAGIELDFKKYADAYKAAGKKTCYDIYTFADWTKSYKTYCVDEHNTFRRVYRVWEVYKCAIKKFFNTRDLRYLPKSILPLALLLPLLGTIFKIRKILRRIYYKLANLRP
jgi:hypothetical protein